MKRRAFSRCRRHPDEPRYPDDFHLGLTHGKRLLGDLLPPGNPTLPTIQGASGISADGLTIVGFGFLPNGHSEGWIATTPEPGTGLLLMAGVLGLAIKRRVSA
jgi:hypothetical protein